MPLINLKTNLKSLKYGFDRPGYGSSGQPYIQTSLPDVINGAGNTNPIFRIQSTGNLDYPIRGGDLSFNLGTQTFTISSQIDKVRIKKFLEDSPRGTAFIQKQIGLQLSNPKIQTGNTLSGFNQSNPLPAILENTRVYNSGLNTLTQVGVQGTGAHAYRHGLIPFNILQKHYYDIVNNENITGEYDANRLVLLTNLKMTNPQSQVISTNILSTFGINTINNLGISLNRNLLFQYLGGPGSVYGVGSTTIKRAVDTTKLIGSRNQMVYDQLRAQSNNAENRSDSQYKKIRDFREPLDINRTWQPSEILEDRFFSYMTGIDRLNKSYPSFFDINKEAPWDINTNCKDDSVDDLIKFVFEALSNEQSNQATAIFFRAFLNDSITDTNTSELNAFKYMGRGENFYTYQGFNRSISFSFRVAAMSEVELIPMYNRINELMGQVYPDYSDKGGVMRAPVVRLTIGDYLHRVPGFIENITATIDGTTPWEININKKEYKGLDSDIAQLPHVVDISVTFRPILDILPRRTKIEKDPAKIPLIVNEPIKTSTTNTSIDEKTVKEIIPREEPKTFPKIDILKKEVPKKTSGIIKSKPIPKDKKIENKKIIDSIPMPANLMSANLADNTRVIRQPNSTLDVTKGYYGKKNFLYKP